MTLPARRAKDGKFALCGRLECGTKLVEIHMGHAVDAEGKGLARLWIGGCWMLAREDDVWVLTEHARKRVRQGRLPRYRRIPPVPRATASIVAVWCNGEPRAVGAGTRREWGRYLNELPAKIKCPACGWIQVLDPAELRVESTTLEGWCTWPTVPPETLEPPLRG